eukprot:m.7917 g.7917  ORF g.7917 m.7917 type:complete len:608 (-) comp4004_c0_seq1:327-2150(-)
MDSPPSHHLARCRPVFKRRFDNVHHSWDRRLHLPAEERKRVRLLDPVVVPRGVGQRPPAVTTVIRLVLPVHKVQPGDRGELNHHRVGAGERVVPQLLPVRPKYHDGPAEDVKVVPLQLLRVRLIVVKLKELEVHLGALCVELGDSSLDRALHQLLVVGFHRAHPTLPPRPHHVIPLHALLEDAEVPLEGEKGAAGEPGVFHGRHPTARGVGVHVWQHQVLSAVGSDGLVRPPCRRQNPLLQPQPLPHPVGTRPHLGRRWLLPTSIGVLLLHRGDRRHHLCRPPERVVRLEPVNHHRQPDHRVEREVVEDKRRPPRELDHQTRNIDDLGLVVGDRLDVVGLCIPKLVKKERKLLNDGPGLLLGHPHGARDRVVHPNPPRKAEEHLGVGRFFEETVEQLCGLLRLLPARNILRNAGVLVHSKPFSGVVLGGEVFKRVDHCDPTLLVVHKVIERDFGGRGDAGRIACFRKVLPLGPAPLLAAPVRLRSCSVNGGGGRWERLGSRGSLLDPGVVEPYRELGWGGGGHRRRRNPRGPSGERCANGCSPLTNVEHIERCSVVVLSRSLGARAPRPFRPGGILSSQVIDVGDKADQEYGGEHHDNRLFRQHGPP